MPRSSRCYAPQTRNRQNKNKHKTAHDRRTENADTDKSGTRRTYNCARTGCYRGQPNLDEKGFNIKPLMYVCEAVRRVFPSKQKLTLDQIKRFIRTEGFFPVSINHAGKVVLTGGQGMNSMKMAHPVCEIVFPNGVTIRLSREISAQTLSLMITIGR